MLGSKRNALLRAYPKICSFFDKYIYQVASLCLVILTITRIPYFKIFYSRSNFITIALYEHQVNDVNFISFWSRIPLWTWSSPCRPMKCTKDWGKLTYLLTACLGLIYKAMYMIFASNCYPVSVGKPWADGYIRNLPELEFSDKCQIPVFCDTHSLLVDESSSSYSFDIGSRPWNISDLWI